MEIIIKIGREHELAVEGQALYADECLDQDGALQRWRRSSCLGDFRIVYS